MQKEYEAALIAYGEGKLQDPDYQFPHGTLNADELFVEMQRQYPTVIFTVVYERKRTFYAKPQKPEERCRPEVDGKFYPELRACVQYYQHHE